MKFKGFIPAGYELVNGRYGKYLRKITGPKPVNSVLARNSSKASLVNNIGSAMLKGIAAERKYFYDGTMYHRLRSLLLLGKDEKQSWWTKDWLEGFEVNDLHGMTSLMAFKSSYSFTRSKLTVELEQILLENFTKKKGKLFDAMKLHVVVLFVDEDKGKCIRYESEPQTLKGKTKKMVFEVDCTNKPKLPYIILLYGEGMLFGQVIESADATGMKVIGSGVL